MQACVQKLDIDKKTDNENPGRQCEENHGKKADNGAMVAMGRTWRTMVGSDDQITAGWIVKICSI